MNEKLLIIGFVWPEPKSSAAGSRMMQLIHYFQSQNYTITFASPCAKSDNAFNLSTIGIKQVSIQLNDESVTIIQVTHSEKNATYGSRIINLLDGRIV